MWFLLIPVAALLGWVVYDKTIGVGPLVARPPQPIPPPTANQPSVLPQQIPPQGKSFSRLALAPNAPAGTATFDMNVGDIIDIGAFADAFNMQQSPSTMLSRIDDSSGFGSTGPNSFLITQPGNVRVTFPNNTAVITAV